MPDLALLGFIVAAGAANLVGALAVTARASWSRNAVSALVAVAAGFMLAVSLLEIIPESLVDEQFAGTAPLLILGGYLLVHLTQHTLAPHFHFGEETHEISKLVGQTALIGLLLHTFVDGVAITSAFARSPAMGELVFLAVLLHKFPEGLAVSSIALAAGLGRKRALMSAGTLGLATVFGGILAGTMEPLARIGLPLSGGVTLYVAASNLVPEFQAKRGWRIPLYFFTGCALYFASRWVLEG